VIKHHDACHICGIEVGEMKVSYVQTVESLLVRVVESLLVRVVEIQTCVLNVSKMNSGWQSIDRCFSAGIF
jgi:hypothetical protein